MALSGSISKTFTNNSMITATLSWTATQNIPSNNSSVTASLKLKSNSTYAPVPTWNGVTATITINGNSASSSINSYVSGGATSGTKYSRTVTVPHNADGTKTFSFGFSINFSDVVWNGSRIGTVSHSGSGTLNTIPRASSIASIVGNQIGGNVTVNITRASSSFKHIVKYTNTAGNVVTVGENVDTSKTFTISMNDCSHLPNSTSGTAKITVDTYSGSSKIGSVTSNHTVYVPDSVKPSFGSLTWLERDENVKKITNGSSTDMLLNISQPRLYINTPSGAYGSRISRYWFVDANGVERTHNGNSLDVPTPIYGGVRTLKGSVQDSRGRWSPEIHISVTVHSYSPVAIHSFSAVRKSGDESHIIKLTKNCSYSAILGNTINYQLKWRVRGGVYANTANITHGVNTYELPGYSELTSYDLMLEVWDKLGATSSTITISTVKTLMDFNKDVGVGIGKLHERGALDVSGDVHVSGGTHTLKGTVNWTPPTSATTAVYTHLLRNSGETLGALYHSVGDDTLALNIYNKAGGYKIHKFGNDGTLSIGGQILENGTRVSTKTHGEVTPTYPDANFAPYNTTYSSDQHPKIYHRNNNVVTISGAITNKVVVDSGWSGRIASIPEWARPRNTVNFITQGSGNSTLLLTIASNGDVNMTRYRDGSESVATPIGSWININCTYVIPL